MRDQRQSTSATIVSPDPESHSRADIASFPALLSDFSRSRPQALSPETSPVDLITPARGSGSRQPRRISPFVSPSLGSDDVTREQSRRDAQQNLRPQTRPRGRPSRISSNAASSSELRSLVMPAAERLVEARLVPENNTDIRTFFSQARRAPADLVSSVQTQDSQPRHIINQLRVHTDQNTRVPIQQNARRPQSAESSQYSKDTAREMDATFRQHQADSSSSTSLPDPRSFPSNIASQVRFMSCSQRHQTADDSIHRINSSILPLNSTPHKYKIHNLTLVVKTSTVYLAQQARKLDMTANSLEWDYDSTDAFDAFASALSERRIMDWVVKVDGMLHVMFERVDGVEVRGALHEGVQRFIDIRKDEDKAINARAIVGITSMDVATHKDKTLVDAECESKPPIYSLDHVGARGAQFRKGVVDRTDTPTKSELPPASATHGSRDQHEKSDREQFVDLDGGAGRQDSPVRNIKAEDEFGSDVDEEMLMDL